MCGACRRPAGERILASILLAILLAAFEGSAARAQERASNSSTLPSSSESLKAADGDGQAASPSPEPLRVPRPSGHLWQPGSVAGSPESAPSGPGSSGWWLGSAGITLVLAVCGAICVAARKFWPQESAGSVRVVGRVSLSARHSIFLVRAGERVLLIGTGLTAVDGATGFLQGVHHDSLLSQSVRRRPALRRPRGWVMTT